MSVDVSFELADPTLAEHRWRLACERDSQAHPPLVAELYAEIGGDSVEAVGGYLYLRAEDSDDDRNDATPNDRDRLDEEWLPRMEALATALDGLEPDAVDERGWAVALGVRIDEWAAIAQGVHRDVLGPAGRAAAAFTDAFVAHFGEGRREDAQALIAAPDSRDARRAVALWELSRILRSQGSRLSATFGPTGGQRVYMQGLDRAREEFPDTTPGRRQDVPTWREDRAMVTRSIRAAAMQPDAASPLEAQRRRDALETELGAATGNGAVEGLRAVLPAARAQALALDALSEPAERLVAAARSMWLRIGRHLESRGALAGAGDVFYFTRAELIAALDGGDGPAHDEIAARRTEHAAFEAAVPPAILWSGEAS
ncbi:MAG: hypothetical protein OXC56_04580 [Chloroflexi bacterium]|nr:hypothetical protein [Chloroflexota bacterium]